MIKFISQQLIIVSSLKLIVRSLIILIIAPIIFIFKIVIFFLIFSIVKFQLRSRCFKRLIICARSNLIIRRRTLCAILSIKCQVLLTTERALCYMFANKQVQLQKPNCLVNSKYPMQTFKKKVPWLHGLQLSGHIPNTVAG